MKSAMWERRRVMPRPIGLQNVTVVVDDAVPSSPNLVAGANEAGYHLLNTNLGRDYEATIIADIAAAGDGDACINCGQPLYTSRGVEVGNIFKLGTRYSAAINATYFDADGDAETDRDGIVRHRIGPLAGLHRRRASRRQRLDLADHGRALSRASRLARSGRGRRSSV